MSTTEPLLYNQYYHIYNRGINSENIFIDDNDYQRFLDNTEKYLPSIAEIYAFVLMKNHFHFFVRIKSESEIEPLSDKAQQYQNVKTISKSLEIVTNKRFPIPEKQFSHLFNSYAKYFNIKHNRHGSLFERPFNRKPVNSKRYFRDLIVYIHNNPVYHDFVSSQEEYPYSSFQCFFLEDDSFINRNQVFIWFDGLENFIKAHSKNKRFEIVEKFINQDY
jgi:putative transposase